LQNANHNSECNLKISYDYSNSFCSIYNRTTWSPIDNSLNKSVSLSRTTTVAATVDKKSKCPDFLQSTYWPDHISNVSILWHWTGNGWTFNSTLSKMGNKMPVLKVTQKSPWDYENLVKSFKTPVDPLNINTARWAS